MLYKYFVFAGIYTKLLLFKCVTVLFKASRKIVGKKDLFTMLVFSTFRDNHPVLTGMFTMAERLWTSEWYAFANADILFDMSLIDTLNFLSKAPTTQPLALLIGETTDVKVSEY